MKKTLIIVFFILIGIAESEAQVTLKPGIRAGVNFSKLTNYNADFKTGFYVGGELAIKFNTLYTLQPELIYSRQGGNGTGNIDNIYVSNSYDPIIYGESKVSYTIDYLSLSAISKFNFGTGFHLLVGPSLDFKVNDNFENNSFSYGEQIGFDLALVGGFGYSLPNGLSFEARFKQGLVDIYGNNYNMNVDQNNNGNFDEVILNQSFQLGVSYTFNLK
jgi:hypothetical protein